MNSVILIGRLASEPSIRHLEASGMSVCDFRLAVDKNFSREKKAQFEAAGKPTADFIRIVVWGKLAELCSNYLKKGMRCAVNGSISTSSYNGKDGERKYSVDVVAKNVEFLERPEARTSSPMSDDQALYDQMAESIDDSFPEYDDTGDIPF